MFFLFESMSMDIPNLLAAAAADPSIEIMGPQMRAMGFSPVYLPRFGINLSGWWFQILFIFIPIWGNDLV